MTSSGDQRTRTRPEHATLLDILIDGFEKNESMYGHHWRKLPPGDEAAAIQKFTEFVAEARSWKGAPLDERSEGPRRLARWPVSPRRAASAGVLRASRLAS